MAPSHEIRRSTSVPNNTTKPSYIRRSRSVVGQSTYNVNGSRLGPIINDYPDNLTCIRDLLIDADAQVNQVRQALTNKLEEQADIQDALNIIPQLKWLVNSPYLLLSDLDCVLDLLIKIQSYLQTSQYHQLTILIEKSRNLIMQVRDKMQKLVNSISENQQQQQQQQQHASVTINSPALVISACLILNKFLESVRIS